MTFLPTSFRRSTRFAAAALLTGALVATPIGSARAAELLVQELGVDRGQVAVRIALVDAFDADARSQLASGLPITVRFTTELWRHRRRWFDKQMESRVLSYQIRWDPGERAYLLRHPGPRRRDSYEELSPLLEDVSRQVLTAYGRWQLEDRRQYFLTIEAAIRPLTLEEFRELDGWIGGRIRGGPDDAGDTDEEAANGGGGGFAQAFFGVLVDLSGFGDLILEARTPSFQPEDLVPLSE